MPLYFWGITAVQSLLKFERLLFHFQRESFHGKNADNSCPLLSNRHWPLFEDFIFPFPPLKKLLLILLAEGEIDELSSENYMAVLLSLWSVFDEFQYNFKYSISIFFPVLRGHKLIERKGNQIKLSFKNVIRFFGKNIFIQKADELAERHLRISNHLIEASPNYTSSYNIINFV